MRLGRPIKYPGADLSIPFVSDDVIVEEVELYYNVSLSNRGRRKTQAEARIVAMCLCHVLGQLGWPDVAAVFGVHRDTAVRSKRVVRDSPSHQQNYRNLTKIILEKHKG